MASDPDIAALRNLHAAYLAVPPEMRGTHVAEGDFELPFIRAAGALLDAAEQLQAVRKALGGYPDSDLTSLATTLQAMASVSEKAQEQLQAVTAERDDWRKACKSMERKVITCGVAATHPDPTLTQTAKYYTDANSPQAERVRRMRAQRDALLAVAERVRAWLASEDLGKWTYTEGGDFYGDVQSHADDLDGAIRAAKETK